MGTWPLIPRCHRCNSVQGLDLKRNVSTLHEMPSCPSCHAQHLRVQYGEAAEYSCTICCIDGNGPAEPYLYIQRLLIPLPIYFFRPQDGHSSLGHAYSAKLGSGFPHVGGVVMPSWLGHQRPLWLIIEHDLGVSKTALYPATYGLLSIVIAGTIRRGPVR